jgi:hypothetical protein
LVGEPEDKRTFERPRRRRTDLKDFKMLDVLEWLHLAQNREKWRAVVNTAINLRVL